MRGNTNYFLNIQTDNELLGGIYNAFWRQRREIYIHELKFQKNVLVTRNYLREPINIETNRIKDRLSWFLL